MANSASDAGNSEKDIRVKLIESGIISQMVTLPSNMFTSVTLPATLWFFDKAKVKKDEILFIDARNIFTQLIVRTVSSLTNRFEISASLPNCMRARLRTLKLC